ncbi:MAG TPA: hypothetical protein VK171_00745 [Fimbriimonas sp.]|nr:hypothetical protein [Fimbriimonas sp.]
MKLAKLSFAVLSLSLLACGGLSFVNAYISQTTFLKDGSGTTVTVIPASGSPAGTVEYHILLNPLASVDEGSLFMNIVRDDNVTMNPAPIQLTSGVSSGEFTASYNLPNNNTTNVRTYTIKVTGRNDAGDSLGFAEDRGTFTQAAGAAQQ